MTTKREKLKREREEIQSAIELVVENICSISYVSQQMRDGGLTERAIVLLLRDMTQVSIENIELILRALPRMGEKYLKSPSTINKIKRSVS